MSKEVGGGGGEQEEEEDEVLVVVVVVVSSPLVATIVDRSRLFRGSFLFLSFFIPSLIH